MRKKPRSSCLSCSCISSFCCSCISCFSQSNACFSADVNDPVTTRHPNQTGTTPSAVASTSDVAPDASSDARAVATTEALPTPQDSQPSYATPSPTPSVVKQNEPKPYGVPSGGKAVDKEDLDGNSDELMKQIEEELLQLVEKANESSKTKTKSKMKKIVEQYSPKSEIFRKLRDFLSDTTNFLKDIIPGDSKTIIHGMLRNMGAAHLATAILLVVANILERIDDVSSNRDECLRIVKEMIFLAKVVKEIKKRRDINERSDLENYMDDEIRKATELITEGYIGCRSQMTASQLPEFFSTTKNSGQLDDLKKKLEDARNHIQVLLKIKIYDAVQPKKPTLSSIYPEYAVGLEKRVGEVIQLLQWTADEKAVAVILHGLSGIGKTTLAEAVYAYSNFEGCQYSKITLSDRIQPESVRQLQSQIIQDLTPEEHIKNVTEVRTHYDGQSQIGELLKKVKAFIYIDNALNKDKLRNLLPNNMNNAKKVRLLLTAREESVIQACPLREKKVYAVKKLESTEAKTLFKNEWQKKQKDSRPLTEIQLNKIVKESYGIPLKLITMAGRISFDKQAAPSDISEEDDNQIAPSDISEGDHKKPAYDILIPDKGKQKLEGHYSLPEDCKDPFREAGITSEGDDRQTAYELITDEEKQKLEDYGFAYDALPEDCKDPFLDICIFFKGMDWDIVKDIVGENELGCLENRNLVHRDTNGVVRMHDAILDLGRQKAKQTRLKSTSAYEIKKFLENKNIQNIKGLWLSENKDLLSISAEKLKLMKSLRILHLGDLIKVDGDRETFNKSILKHLIFFQGAVPFLPFVRKEANGLKYLSYQPRVWELLEMPPHLRHVDFDGRLHFHAFEISGRELEQVNNLRICKLTGFPKLKSLPKDLGEVVKNMEELTLSYCKSIEELPHSISKLKLRVLRMVDCSNLLQLPENFGSLSSLQELNLQGCTKLKELPSSFENLSSLKLLNLSYCERLSKLPHGIGYLPSLVKLSLKRCANLASIPESIGRLRSLAFALDMSGCSTLTELPSLIGQLEYIRELNLCECSNLEELPESFRQLRNLVKLNLSNCSTLKELCHSFHLLSSLRILDLSGCKMLEELPPGFGCLGSLQNLYLSGCERLQKLTEDFHCLPSLQHLYISYCHMLEGKSIDNLLKMKRLQIINIQGSSLLVNRWEELQREGNQSLFTAVYTGKDLSEEEKEKLFPKLLSELDDLLVDENKNPFRISKLPPNKVSLVMFHSDPDDDFPSPLLKETTDDIRDLNFEIIYIGKHFDKFPSNVKDRILGRSDESREVELMAVKLLFTLDKNDRESWLSTLDENVQKVWLERYIAEEPVYFQMTMEDGKGQTRRPCWKVLSNCDVEEFVFGKCKKVLELNRLVEPRQEKNSNIWLLRELFGTRAQEAIFKRGSASNQDPRDNSKQPFTCRVDDLKGKTILLEMGCVDLCNDIGLWSLAEMYRAEKDKLNLDLEIISLPLMESSTHMMVVDGSEPSSREVPWLVVQNPRIMTRASKYFLAKQSRWKRDGKDNILQSNIIWVIESNGRISICNSFMFFILNMRGPKGYSFKWENFEKLRKTEWNQLNSISSIDFLLKHLEVVFKQVAKKMLEAKMICLYGGNTEFTCYIRNVLIALRDSIHILYIPRHGHEIKKMLKITDNIYKEYYSLEKPEMPSAEMEGISLLTEHETNRFWMSLRYLKEEINGMCNNDKEFYEIKSLLHLFKLMEEGNGNGWMIFISKDRKTVTACGGEKMKWLFKDDKEHRAKRLIKQLVKVSREEIEQIHDESSIPASTNSMQTVVVSQENVDVDLNSLSKYTSELLEMVQIQQLLDFKKEKKLSRPKAAVWPDSIGSRLKKFLSEGRTVVDDIISQHPEEDILEMVIQSLLDGISGKTHLAAAGLLVVAEILEAFGSASHANRNECLLLLEEMNGVAQHIKPFNERPHLSEETMREATMLIVHCSIACCAQIDPSKFAMFFKRSVSKKELRRLQKWLRNRSQEVLLRLQDDFHKNENGSPRSSAINLCSKSVEDVASSYAPNQDSTTTTREEAVLSFLAPNQDSQAQSIPYASSSTPC